MGSDYAEVDEEFRYRFGYHGATTVGMDGVRAAVIAVDGVVEEVFRYGRVFDCGDQRGIVGSAHSGPAKAFMGSSWVGLITGWPAACSCLASTALVQTPATQQRCSSAGGKGCPRAVA